MENEIVESSELKALADALGVSLRDAADEKGLNIFKEIDEHDCIEPITLQVS